jgi:hypothetical protein
MPVGFGYVQGYNAHAAVNEQQIVLAAEITNTSTDFSQLDPMTTATLAELQRGRGQRVARGGGRRCRLLQRAAHGRGDRQQAHPGADPARQRQPRHPTPGLGRRALHLDAEGPGHTARPAHLPKTQTDHPAAVRPHQAQPRSQPLPPPRQDRRAHRMAVTDGHPQPHQAPPPPPRRRRAPTRPHAGETPPITTDTMATSKPPSNDPHPPEPFQRQPPSWPLHKGAKNRCARRKGRNLGPHLRARPRD